MPGAGYGEHDASSDSATYNSFIPHQLSVPWCAETQHNSPLSYAKASQELHNPLENPILRIPLGPGWATLPKIVTCNYVPGRITDYLRGSKEGTDPSRSAGS